jgi:hypothetical protein
VNRVVRHLLVLGALAALALPAPAFASADQVVRDCARDGKLDHNYSNAELRRARNNLPADLADSDDRPKVDIGGSSLEPDSSGFFNLKGAANDVPLPLVLALLLLSALALASGIGALRERMPALARIPLLSKIPTPRVPFFGRRS